MSWHRNWREHLLTFAVFFCALCSSHALASAARDWQESINDDGIRVFKRARSGSPYEEVRAEARLAAKVDDFIPFFSEPVQYKKWVYGTLQSELVNQSQPLDFVFKGVFKIPWPFENRELISRVAIERKSDRTALLARLSHSSSASAVTPGCVRVTHFESLWAVNQLDPSNVELSIEMYVEPGGQLPPFIVNLVLSRIQLWSIKNLKREIAAR